SPVTLSLGLSALLHLFHSFFLYTAPAPSEICTLSLHDALPICSQVWAIVDRAQRSVLAGAYRGKETVNAGGNRYRRLHMQHMTTVGNDLVLQLAETVSAFGHDVSAHACLGKAIFSIQTQRRRAHLAPQCHGFLGPEAIGKRQPVPRIESQAPASVCGGTGPVARQLPAHVSIQ